jgi:hypothetical protein
MPNFMLTGSAGAPQRKCKICFYATSLLSSINLQAEQEVESARKMAQTMRIDAKLCLLAVSLMLQVI